MKKIMLIKKIFERLKGNHISRKAIINKLSFFEGGNYVGANTNVINTYVGFMSYIGVDCDLSYSKIGKFSSIANRCHVILGNHPTKVIVSTHPAFYSPNRPIGKSYTNRSFFSEYKYVDNDKKYMISIGNDVWIGSDVKILGGISIGDGAIIACGSVVVKDVPPYAIVGGVPAKIIRYRFNDDQIKKLLEIQWWNKSEKWLMENVDDFSNIDVFLAKNS